MTSDQKSAPHPPDRSPYLAIESPGGAWHPHQIEVQDFGSYGLIVDVRSKAEYLDDHIPGAVNVDFEGAATGVPAALRVMRESRDPDEPVLVYCGSGGRVSGSLAEMLRMQGRTVDVLPGGWINYRRWVQAGLQLLPRLFEWRVLGCSLGSEARRVLEALQAEGHQVLDIGAIAGWSEGRLAAGLQEQPPQAWFESQLVDALRQLGGRCQVWAADLCPDAGTVSLPQALVDALSIAPTASVESPLPVRLRQWRLDEPVLTEEPSDVLARVLRTTPPPDVELAERWQSWTRDGAADSFLVSLLKDHVDANYRMQAARYDRRSRLPAIVIESFEPDALARAIRSSVPLPA